MLLGKGVLKTCRKHTGELPCQSMQSNFIEIVLRPGYSPVNLPHIFKTDFYKNSSGELLLIMRHPEIYEVHFARQSEAVL